MSTTINNPPIRVCFIAPKAYPLFNPDIKAVFGGAEVDLYFLATELAKDENFIVSFITADYGQEEIETIAGVRIIKSLNFEKNPLTGAIRVWRAMKAAASQIYFQKVASWGTFLVALFCKLHKKTFIYRTAQQIECDGTYLKQHFFTGCAFRWSLRSAAQVVVQNKIDQKGLEQTISIHSIVIPNAHRLPMLSNAERDTILWVGRSAPVKRPELFIDLAGKMPSEHFTMICQHATGDQSYEELVARARKVKNLQFIQRVPFSEIGSFFQRAKVFVNTSDAEGFPNTFIQACEFAAPILSLNVNPDSFLDEYNCGICCEGSLERFTDSLGFMLAENRYIEMGRKARKYVEQNHDIKRTVEEYKKIFRQLYGKICIREKLD